MSDSASYSGGTVVGSVVSSPEYSGCTSASLPSCRLGVIQNTEQNDRLPIKEIFSSIQGEGEGAGRRQIFIRLTGCNLACSYCDTDFASADCWCAETFPGSGDLKVIRPLPSLKTVTDLVEKWCLSCPGAHHSITLTGGEPLLHADALLSLLPELRRILPVSLETNGTLSDQLLQVVSMLDAISMDMKLPSTAGVGNDIWDTHRRFLAIASSVKVSVKMVVGESTSVDEVLQGCSIIKDAAINTPLFLQPLTAEGGKIGISAPHLLCLQAAAAEMLPDVRVIPQMHLMMGAL